MSKVVETKYGRVAFIDSKKYFEDGLFKGSMGEVSKKTGANYVLLLGDKVKEEDVGVEKAEELIEVIMNPAQKYTEVVEDFDE